MIMIRNICYENIIDLISLHRLSQCLIGTVIIIGCWHHIDSHIFVLALLFSLLIYQTAVLLIYSSQQLQGSNKLLNSTIHSIDGVFCGIICLICNSSNTLAVSISALFLLIYLQTLGLKALYGIVSLFCTVLICSNLDFKAYSLNSFCKLTELCEHSIYLILIVFLIIYSYLKNSYDHRLNSHLVPTI
jgi:hypothetical protein